MLQLNIVSKLMLHDATVLYIERRCLVHKVSVGFCLVQAAFTFKSVYDLYRKNVQIDGSYKVISLINLDKVIYSEVDYCLIWYEEEICDFWIEQSSSMISTRQKCCFCFLCVCVSLGGWGCCLLNLNWLYSSTEFFD